MKSIFLKTQLYLLVLLFLPDTQIKAQTNFKDKIEFNGYVSGIGSSNYDNFNDERFNEGLIHNRLNLQVYPTDKITFSIQARNRFFYSESFTNPMLSQQQELNNDNGWMDLTQNIYENNKTAFNINIDRLYLQYTLNNLEIKVGRQRINWGQTFAWNPNDIFNTYNYFELDYPERQGSDAVRLQYYTGFTSRVEFAMSIDSDKKKTIAALYQTNISNVDVQLISGIYKDDDFVVGSAFVGNISSLSISGEGSYFFSKDKQQNIGYITLSSGYTFPNSLYIMAEGLMNITKDEKDIFSFFSITNESSSIKNLSFSDFSLLTQVSYPITPLITMNFSNMIFVKLNGFYLGPSTDISLTNNLSLSLAYQYIVINPGDIDPGFLQSIPVGSSSAYLQKLLDLEKIKYNYAFLRLKYNF